MLRRFWAMRSMGIFVFLAHMLAPSRASAEPLSAPRPQISSHYEASDRSVTFINQEPAPYTLTVRFSRFENTAIACAQPCTFVLPPHAQRRFALSKIKPLDPWHFNYHYHYQRGDYRAEPLLKFVYQLPYAQGANYKLGQAYDGDFTHQGDGRFSLDFLLPLGTPVHAARSGRVIWTVDHFREGGITEAFRGKANQVEVLHADGSMALYAHLQWHGVKVKPGELVQTGQLLGYSGNTGYSGGPHLHFQVSHTVSGEQQKTLPTLFLTSQGLAILKSGQTYLRP
jgi:murein DD-endopeptidase MepM/ murein hydrolase activator NlpD